MHQILTILEEATDSMGPDLISLDDLKLALGITGTAEDAQLQAAITFRSQIIAEYCDRRFGRAEAIETFTLDPGEFVQVRSPLTLSLYPVAEIIEVSCAGATAQQFEFDPPSGRVWLQDGWPWWPGWQGTYPGGWWPGWQGKIEIVYSGGYDLPEEAPARLSRAVIESINEVRTMGGRDSSIREVQHGDTRIAYFTSPTATATTGFLSGPVIELISPYKRYRVA